MRVKSVLISAAIVFSDEVILCKKIYSKKQEERFTYNGFGNLFEFLQSER